MITNTATSRVRVADAPEFPAGLGPWITTANADGSETRARLERDEFAVEPERGEGMWNDGVMLICDRNGYNGTDLDEFDPLTWVLERIEENRDGTVTVFADPRSENVTADGVAKCDRVTFVRRYLRAFHNVLTVELRRHRGYCQSDWADVWVITDAAEFESEDSAQSVANATWDEWDAWARGDVYVAMSQERTLMDAMNAEDEEDGWGDSEYVGGVYGEDGGRLVQSEVLGVSLEDIPAHPGC